VTVFRLEDGRYAAGERARAGRIPSRALPALEIAIDEIFAD